MNVKRFQRICKVVSVVLLLVVGYFLFVSLFMLFVWLRGNNELFINLKIPSGLVLYTVRTDTATEKQQLISSVVALIPESLSTLYILFKGSRLFAWLGKGNSPFQPTFVKAVKRIGILMMAVDALTPLLYSAVLSLLLPSGYYFQLHFSSLFLIGIIFYCLAEILHYGITLQQLADDTV